jgi:hypothetical protein
MTVLFRQLKESRGKLFSTQSYTFGMHMCQLLQRLSSVCSLGNRYEAHQLQNKKTKKKHAFVFNF